MKVHYGFVEIRRSCGINDGPVYRDVDNPNAALFHARVESMPRAMEWFGSQRLKDATAKAGVTGREIYLAERRDQPAVNVP